MTSMSAYLPPPRALWSGIFALVTSVCSTVGALYAQLSGEQTRIGRGAWIVVLCGAIGAAFLAGKAAWVAPVRARRRVSLKRVVKEEP
jgi:hypothetical protein